jgi:RHS repeat-associated protein
MTNASQAIAGSAIYQPIGEASTAQNTTIDLRFPGQWFQLETGLHYNWHRHYDPKTGGICSWTRWDLSMRRAFTHVRAVIRFRASTDGIELG